MADPAAANTEAESLREIERLAVRLEQRTAAVALLQDRMSRLLHANLSVVEDLDLAGVLSRIVHAAADLVGASYGAIGVLAPDGTLEQFVHTGMDVRTVELIGHLPEGKGLLGALVRDSRPIRLDDLTTDPRSVGFPEHHPPMASFLGVPIRVRDEVFGNLYLCNHRGQAGFTVDDEGLATALAASAAVAIENARLYQDSVNRERWAEGTAEIMQQLIEDDSDALQRVAERVRDLADADLVSVLLPSDEGFVVSRACGEYAEERIGSVLTLFGSLPGLALTTGRPQLLDDIADGSVVTHLPVDTFGPEIAIPLVSGDTVHGVLAVARTRGRKRFTAADLDVADSFAAHATVALALAEAHALREQMIVLEDRDRIARDLHDHVIQRLFATGLTLQSLTGDVDSAGAKNRLAEQVHEIDETIRQVRNTIFELRSTSATQSLRSLVLRTVRSVVAGIDLAPQVYFGGPVDTLVAPALHDDVVAVIREAVTNVAKHARAEHVQVRIDASPRELCIEIDDDGIGIPAEAPRSGLTNLESRARLLGGTMTVEHHDGYGTTLCWTAPLEGAGR